MGLKLSVLGIYIFMTPTWPHPIIHFNDREYLSISRGRNPRGGVSEGQGPWAHPHVFHKLNFHRIHRDLSLSTRQSHDLQIIIITMQFCYINYEHNKKMLTKNHKHDILIIIHCIYMYLCKNTRILLYYIHVCTHVLTLLLFTELQKRFK